MKRIQCNCCGAPIPDGLVGKKVCCPYCGTVFLLDESVILPDEPVRSDDPEVPDLPPESIIDDWQCPFCDTMNQQQAEFCSKCGCGRINPSEMQEWELPKTLHDDEIMKESSPWHCTICGMDNDKDYHCCCSCGALRLYNL